MCVRERGWDRVCVRACLCVRERGGSFLSEEIRSSNDSPNISLHDYFKLGLINTSIKARKVQNNCYLFGLICGVP